MSLATLNKTKVDFCTRKNYQTSLTLLPDSPHLATVLFRQIALFAIILALTDFA